MRRPRRPARSSAAALAASLALLAGVATVLPEPAAAAAQRPNIVLIVTDDQTLESVAKMPHVSSRRDWIRFPQAWIQNSMCCPSRATILTGQYDTHTGVTNNGQTSRFDQSQTVATWLRAAGYRTGLVGKYLNGYPEAFGRSTPFVPPGWTDWQAAYGVVRQDPVRGRLDTLYDQYGYELSDNGRHVHYGHRPEDYQVTVLAKRARQFIAESADRPFFLYFAPTATHGLWVASPRRTGAFAGAPVPHGPAFNERDVSDKPRHIRQLPLQDRAVRDDERRREWAAALSVDDGIATLDAQLKASGVYDDTVVIFMTDNGYAFGEHRVNGKRCEYAVCGRTPLLVRYPGRPAATVGEVVSNVDIASTVAQLAGTTPRIRQDGRSLVPLLQGRDVAWRDAVLTHWPGDWKGDPSRPGHVPQFWGLNSARYTYVEIPSTGERELYDRRTDPHQLTNLAGRPQVAGLQAQLRVRLAELRAQALARGRTGAAPSTTVPVLQEDD